VIETTPALGWRETIDRDAERIKREIREMAKTARRSISQRIRWMRDKAREAA
jgi:hypothetical protein